ncbi:hypothetical protein NDU88_003173 [Pleurodeles waltl]|uniref:Uncharacterized protein n=1 Tax=Pleurodeles waltl TaxID=8319 RepID=A0AAV7M6C9_PLEWA|nr:hypothetical protein NDU88_003173 [Pleurodeles waltl]
MPPKGMKMVLPTLRGKQTRLDGAFGSGSVVTVKTQKEVMLGAAAPEKVREKSLACTKSVLGQLDKFLKRKPQMESERGLMLRIHPTQTPESRAEKGGQDMDDNLLVGDYPAPSPSNTFTAGSLNALQVMDTVRHTATRFYICPLIGLQEGIKLWSRESSLKCSEMGYLPSKAGRDNNQDDKLFSLFDQSS